MPKLESCQKCHNPSAGVRNDCAECHTYHDRKLSDGKHRGLTIDRCLGR